MFNENKAFNVQNYVKRTYKHLTQAQEFKRLFYNSKKYPSEVYKTSNVAITEQKTTMSMTRAKLEMFATMAKKMVSS